MCVGVTLISAGLIIRPSNLRFATPCSSVNGFDCFENLKEFDYLRRKVFQKVLKRSSASLSGIYRLDLHGLTK